MSVPVIKAITKRIRLRIGTTEAAAAAANVSPGVWSGYENADKPETTIPLGRLLDMSLTAAERREIAKLFSEEGEQTALDALREASEATEAVADLQRTVRLAAIDGELTETEKRDIRSAALAAEREVHDVLKAVS